MPILAAVNWSAGLQDAWNQIASFVPKLLAFGIILVVGYIVAKALGKALDVILERVNFDRAVERGGVRKALAKSQYDASDVLGKLLFYTVMLFVLQAAFGVFGANPISDLLASVVAYLPNLFVALVIVVVTAAIAAAVKEVVEATLGGLSYGTALANAAGVAIVALGFFAALNQLEIAEEIVNGLYYATLAIIVGVTVIAVGGGGVGPMQSRWQGWLDRLSSETANVKREAAGASERISARASERAEQASSAAVDVREQSSSSSTGATSATRTPQGF